MVFIVSKGRNIQPKGNIMKVWWSLSVVCDFVVMLAYCGSCEGVNVTTGWSPVVAVIMI